MNGELFEMDQAGEDGWNIQYGRDISVILVFCPDWYDN